MLTGRLLILSKKEAECKEMTAYFEDSGSGAQNMMKQERFFPGERTNRIC